MTPNQRWLSETLTFAMLACFAVGCWFATQAALRFDPFASAAYRSPVAPPTGSALVTKNIEDVRVSERRVGQNPLCEYLWDAWTSPSSNVVVNESSFWTERGGTER